ncbi:hypothetical protein ACFC8U_15945 [Enterococcus casseliflavus]|uniref:hypothetical protein n=1 Tax=Enterococcus casseliflavus TaxID=37734 RepID=UPI00232F2959|nr:hypothetical protein [Enterococcus casseliflavus]MDB1693522.1 hypothetical protein [Enterococcus casseliflavus]
MTDEISIYFIVAITMIMLFLTLLMLLTVNIRDKKHKKELEERRRRTEIDDIRLKFEAELYALRKEFYQNREKDDNNYSLSDSMDRLVLEGQDNYVYINKQSNEKIDPNLILYLTPFSELKEYTSVSLAVEQVVESSGLDFVRSDDQIEANIFNHILSLIKKANVIIVNITGQNPNVFYELGIAHSLNKKVIIIAASEETGSVPFDIANKRIIFYDDVNELQDRLKKVLIKTIIN